MGEGDGLPEMRGQSSEESRNFLFISEIDDLWSSGQRILEFIEILYCAKFYGINLHEGDSEIEQTFFI